MYFKNTKYYIFIIAIFVLLQALLSNINANSYVLNKNRIYIQDKFIGYLKAEGGFWSVTCKENNTKDCSMSQFVKSKSDDTTLSILINNKNYMSVTIMNVYDTESLADKITLLTSSRGMNFDLDNKDCYENSCEYSISMQNPLIEKLLADDKFIIGIKNLKKNNTIGYLINSIGFAEMYKQLENK